MYLRAKSTDKRSLEVCFATNSRFVCRGFFFHNPPKSTWESNQGSKQQRRAQATPATRYGRDPVSRLNLIDADADLLMPEACSWRVTTRCQYSEQTRINQGMRPYCTPRTLLDTWPLLQPPQTNTYPPTKRPPPPHASPRQNINARIFQMIITFKNRQKDGTFQILKVVDRSTSSLAR